MALNPFPTASSQAVTPFAPAPGFQSRHMRCPVGSRPGRRSAVDAALAGRHRLEGSRLAARLARMVMPGPDCGGEDMGMGWQTEWRQCPLAGRAATGSLQTPIS